MGNDKTVEETQTRQNDTQKEVLERVELVFGARRCRLQRALNIILNMLKGLQLPQAHTWSLVASMPMLRDMARVTVGVAPRKRPLTPSSFTILHHTNMMERQEQSIMSSNHTSSSYSYTHNKAVDSFPSSKHCFYYMMQ